MSVEKLQEDKRVKNLIKAIKQGIYYIDDKKYISEISALHATGKLRGLTKNEVVRSFSNKFLSAILQNSANRSRIVEIKMTVMRIKFDIEDHLDNLKKLLKIDYTNTLSKYKTQSDKDAVINIVLREANEVIKKAKNVCDIADLVINDIDQAGWVAKNIISAMEMQIGKKAATL